MEGKCECIALSDKKGVLGKTYNFYRYYIGDNRFYYKLYDNGVYVDTYNHTDFVRCFDKEK